MMLCDLVYTPLGQQPMKYSIAWASQMTVADVIQRSGVQTACPEIDGLAVGVFGRCVPQDTLVKPGDRIEIYRPLLIDPKEKRRRIAKKR